MRTSSYFVSVAILLTLAAVVSASTIPPESILVSTRLNPTGVVALDLNGNVVGGFAPQGATHDMIDVQQISPNGDILFGQHPSGSGDGDLVSRYEVDGDYVGTVSGTVSGQFAAHLAIADPLDGSHLAFIEHNMGTISSIDLTTNAVVNTFTFPVSSSVNPRGIDVGPDGFLYVAVQNSGIWKFTQDLSSHSIVASDPSRNSYADITFGPDGLLYASTYGHDGVVRYDVNTGVAQTFIPDADSSTDLYVGVMFHPTTGDLLVSNYKTGDIRKYNGTTGVYEGVFANVPNAWNMSMAPAAVPEPSTLTIILMSAGSFVAMWYRRRR